MVRPYLRTKKNPSARKEQDGYDQINKYPFFMHFFPSGPGLWDHLAASAAGSLDYSSSPADKAAASCCRHIAEEQNSEDNSRYPADTEGSASGPDKAFAADSCSAYSGADTSGPDKQACYFPDKDFPADIREPLRA